MVNRKKQLVGVWSENDLLTRLPFNKPVSMEFLDQPLTFTEDTMAVEPETTLQEIGELFFGYGVERFPVVNTDREVIGMIDKRDLLNAIFRELELMLDVKELITEHRTERDSKATEASQKEIPGYTTKNILIVDDEALVRHMEKNILTQAGFNNLFEASSLKQAIAILLKEKIDCILLDWKLGNESGLRLAEKVKATREDLVVIMVTGESDEERIREAIHLGVDAYIIKPIVGRSFIQTVISILNVKSA